MIRFRNLPDWARRSARTFLQAFAGVFLLSLVGWLGDVTTWASCAVDCEPFPSTSPLGKAAVAAAAAAAVAVVTGVQNLLEDRTRLPALLKADHVDAGHAAPPLLVALGGVGLMILVALACLNAPLLL